MPRSIRVLGDPILRAEAQPISEITPEIRQLAQEMIEIMIESDGVGLAANQIGELIRIFVMRDEVMNQNGEYELVEPEVIINPTLSRPSPQKATQSEGCLSLPGVSLKISRPKSIHLRYQNLEGEWIEERLSGLRARIAMHETDHLNGVLILDRAKCSK